MTKNPINHYLANPTRGYLQKIMKVINKFPPVEKYIEGELWQQEGEEKMICEHNHNGNNFITKQIYKTKDISTNP